MNTAANYMASKLGKRDVPLTTEMPHSSTEKMHAITWNGTYDVVYSEVPKPVIADPGDALVRVTATTVCGSDLHAYAKEIQGFRKGMILGHEAMGIIEEVGEGVRKLKVGDRVVLSFCISCGQCSHCKRGQWSGCEKTNPTKLMKGMYGHTFSGIYGYGELGGSFAGSQAEFVRVPIADVNCLKLPDSVPDEKGLYLSDVAVTSFHAAVDLGQVQRGDVVAIWGAGPIGLLTAKWCEIYGAKQIYVIEDVLERIALVEQNIRGAHTINFDEVDVTEELQKLCPEGVDVAIECAGFRYAKSSLHKMERAMKMETDTADNVNECIYATKLFGRVVLIADYVGYTNHFNIGALMEKHIYLSGGQCPVQSCWDRVLQHIQKGDFDPTICVTHKGKLEDAPAFYAKMFYKQDGVVKTFLRP